MSHVRTQIRAAIVATLSPIATTHASRVHRLEQDALPVLLVYTNNEEVVEGGPMSAVQRQLEVEVSAVATGDAVDDQLDALIAAVEAALNASTLGGLVVHLLPRSLQMSISTEGSQPIGRATLTFEALYRTSMTDPETAI
jgi:hypothetical protein